MKRLQYLLQDIMLVLEHFSSWRIPKYFQNCVDRRIYLACNWCLSFNSTLIQLASLSTGMKKNFPSDCNFKGDTYWCWKAAKIVTLLLMRSLKSMLGKPSLFVCFRYVPSRDTAASSNYNHHNLRLENWYRVALFPYCSRTFPCKSISLLQIQRQMLLETFSSFHVSQRWLSIPE